MKRFLPVICIALLLLELNGMTTAKAEPLREACRYGRTDGVRGWSVEEVKKTIRCAARRWSVPGGVDKALDIAYRESRFQQFATSWTGCKGIYQFTSSTWWNLRQRFPHLARLTSHDPYRARSNVLLAIRTAHSPIGWAPWGG